MLFKFIPATLATLSFLSSVSAWGALGHKTVASVAMQFLLPQTNTTVSSILSADRPKPSTIPTLADVANWADDYAHTLEGAWSWVFHYVDVKDNPPTSCGVDFVRDCNEPARCIITGIRDYTERVQDASLDAEQRAEALKYLVHLFGDVTLPLNAEALQMHGWNITVLWDGQQTNLRYVWEILMPEQLAGDDSSSPVDTLTIGILQEIRHGEYKSLVPSWLSCPDINQAQTCATAWASDANALICSYVLNPIPEGQELSGAYCAGAAPIIAMQLAKGGVRLAAWLNQIFARSAGFETYF